SASKQEGITEDWIANPEKEFDPVGMFALSATGYQRLGLKASAPADPALGAKEFCTGLKKQPYGWTLEQNRWERKYRDPIDAFLPLANDDVQRLSDSVAQVTADLKGIATVVAQECGYRLKSPIDGSDIEHFGFRDGISKVPCPCDVLTPEQPSGSRPTYGCFATFLKIEQNVAEFRRL